MFILPTGCVAQWLRGQLSFLRTPVRVLVGVGLESLFPSCLYWVLLCSMPVTPAVPYMLIGLAGCSVGREISRGARKLARTPTLIIKKKMFILFVHTTESSQGESLNYQQNTVLLSYLNHQRQNPFAKGCLVSRL